MSGHAILFLRDRFQRFILLNNMRYIRFDVSYFRDAIKRSSVISF